MGTKCLVSFFLLGLGVLLHWALRPAHCKYLFIYFLNHSFYSSLFRNHGTTNPIIRMTLHFTQLGAQVCSVGFVGNASSSVLHTCAPGPYLSQTPALCLERTEDISGSFPPAFCKVRLMQFSFSCDESLEMWRKITREVREPIHAKKKKNTEF